VSRIQAVAQVLKERFPNLGVLETLDLAEKIIAAIELADKKES